MASTADCSDPVLQFMRDHAIETAQSRFAILDAITGESQELHGRSLPHQLQGVGYPLPAEQQIPRRAADLSTVDTLQYERAENGPKNLVLLEYLVSVESLRVAQRTQLHRLCDNRRRFIQVTFGMLEIVGDSVDEERDVIEQLLSREDVFALERHAGIYSLEPARHQIFSRASQHIGKVGGEQPWIGHECSIEVGCR